jgi:hypothetical protein
MKDFTRVCRIGEWLKQTSVKSNFQHVLYTIFFRRPQKNAELVLIFLFKVYVKVTTILKINWCLKTVVDHFMFFS